MNQTAQLIDDLRAPTKALSRAIPDVWTAFTELHKAVLTDGALSARVKELMALAVAVARECDGCVAYHAKAAARAGATPEEVAETLGVALLLMSGGPASVYGPRAWAAFDEFAPSTGEEEHDPRTRFQWPRSS